MSKEAVVARQSEGIRWKKLKKNKTLHYYTRGARNKEPNIFCGDKVTGLSIVQEQDEQRPGTG